MTLNGSTTCVRFHVLLLKILHVTYEWTQKAMPGSSIMMRWVDQADAVFSELLLSFCGSRRKVEGKTGKTDATTAIITIITNLRLQSILLLPEKFSGVTSGWSRTPRSVVLRIIAPLSTWPLLINWSTNVMNNWTLNGCSTLLRVKMNRIVENDTVMGNAVIPR